MDPKKNAEYERWLQHTRFRWHEAVLKDPAVHGSSSVIALAGHIMHRYRPDKGYAQFSIASAVKALGFDERTVKRARKQLRQLGWIRPDDRPVKTNASGWRANRYILSGGPEDLLFDQPGHPSDSDSDDTDT